MPRAFPEGFRWGTATAAHQVEGNNTNHDWWDFEHTPGSGCREPSGDACDQYHRFAEDIELVARLGLHSYRFSLEWSRIEPAEGEFSRAALDHYRRVCASCLEQGVEPVVTFHHFTTPRWMAATGGWAEPSAVDRFGRFCEVSGGYLADLIGRACTLNEPNIVALMGYSWGVFPPGEKDEGRYHAVQDIMRDAHRRGYDVLKEQLGDTPVGLTLAMNDTQAVPADDPAAVTARDRARADHEDHYLAACGGDDFIGVQCYTRLRVGPSGVLPWEDGVEVLPMGYEYYPQALGGAVRHAWEATGGTPVLVTENGIGTDDDDQRIAYLSTALSSLLDAVDAGVDVQGYTVWSLLDNFEWAMGYDARFGIVDVDRGTQMRTPKPSAWWLSDVVRENALPD